MEKEDINNINKEIFALQLKSAAMTYRDLFSMNISPIEGDKENGDSKARFDSYMNPIINLDNREYDWHQATGLGVNLGDNNVWALDINTIPCGKQEREQFISNILCLLRLPNDYAWLSYTGEGGLHVLFRSQFIGNAQIDDNVLEFSGRFDYMKVYLRMSGFLVLPPSLFYYGGKYEFVNGQMPTYEPLFVSADSLYSFFSKYYSIYDTIWLRKDNWGLYLQRKAIVKKVYDRSFPLQYDCNDVVELLESCHHPEALNSLGCLYAQKALGSLMERNELFELAKKAFKESGDNYAQSNIKAISAIQEDTSSVLTEPLNHYGDYGYVVLRKRKFKYLFVDTETTGLPIKNDASYKDICNWPRLVQLGWICVSEDGEIILEDNRYIRPVGFIIPEEAAKVHGVSTAKAVHHGEDVEKVLLEFGDCAHVADFIVGHNVGYDVNVICSEFYRLNDRHLVNWHVFGEPWCDDRSYDEMISTLPIIDTMVESVNYCRLPGYNGQYKYPKLQELYKCLFGKEFDNAHNAMADIRATLECFNALKEKGYINQ